MCYFSVPGLEGHDSIILYTTRVETMVWHYMLICVHWSAHCTWCLLLCGKTRLLMVGLCRLHLIKLSPISAPLSDSAIVTTLY